MTNLYDKVGAAITALGFLVLTATFITAPWATTEIIIGLGTTGGLLCVAGCMTCSIQPDQEHSHSNSDSCPNDTIDPYTSSTGLSPSYTDKIFIAATGQINPPGISMEDSFTKEQLAEIKSTDKVWDI